jgi:hypothetical protein
MEVTCDYHARTPRRFTLNEKTQRRPEMAGSDRNVASPTMIISQRTIRFSTADLHSELTLAGNLSTALPSIGMPFTQRLASWLRSMSCPGGASPLWDKLLEAWSMPQLDDAGRLYQRPLLARVFVNRCTWSSCIGLKRHLDYATLRRAAGRVRIARPEGRYSPQGS